MPIASEHPRLLFSRFDRGIKFDQAGLECVTPEEEANRIAHCLPGKRVLDAFCGLGGNSIAFALAGKRVIGVDISARRIAMARINCAIYGVKQRVQLIRSDAVSILTSEEFHVDSVFLDPPWRAGTESLNEFSLDDFVPSGRLLLDMVFRKEVNVALCVASHFRYGDLRGFPKHAVLKSNSPWSFATVIFECS